jgi:Tol biopolymer transport system component/DNA-binding winged helix-turn-helix (wHTH) protein
MSQPAANPTVLRFGLFELDLTARELRKAGVRIKLQDQPFQILAMLLERPGAIVTREELTKKLWPGDTFVDFDLSLNSAVKKVRQALNDDSENPRFVETLYRRGYRFIGPIQGAPSLDQVQPANGASLTAAPAEPIPIHSMSPSSIRRRRILLYLYVAIPILLLLIAGGTFWLIPPRPPRVLGYTQITHDALQKGAISTDGQRLYFQQLQGDHFVVSQVSVAGGETSVVPTPFENVFVADVAPNGSSLLLGSFHGTGKSMELWSLPLPSGAPRRLGDFVADSATWSPDGGHLLFSTGPDIYETNRDGSQPRKLATVGSQVFGLRFSPDGSTLRFDVMDTRHGSSSIWELQRDGTGLHPLLSGWNSDPHECCGNWTPDGKYFVFQSLRDGRNSIWALPEKSTWLARDAKPVPLTNGPLDFTSPVSSKDGKRIFSFGAQPRCELVRFDSKSGFVPYLGGISIRDLTFSPDGEWIAYVTVPERQLWKSRADGTDRRQLTFESMATGVPRWSPDGTQIVFMAETLKTGWRAYLISSDGTALRELIPGADAGYDPNWSADGKSIVLTLNDAGSPSSMPSGPGIATVDLQTGKVSPLPGAKQMFSPRWSPDGRYIAAITDDSEKLMLFDRASQQWQQLVSLPMGYPSWSHDGKYIYFDTTLTEDATFFRVRISDRKLERLVSLNGMRRYWGDLGSWTALTPDDSPLLIRDVSSQEIYALDWQAP